jgi:hypothetical protein
MLSLLVRSEGSRAAGPGADAEVIEAFVAAAKRCGGDSSISSGGAVASSGTQAALLRPFLLHLRGDLEQKPLIDGMKSAELGAHPAAVAALVDILWLLGTQV